ncbi:MAG: EndoU domain-containing protein, partial [Polaromonas sp.]|nr:EndoU domain-containing protein [Polaromonas sp.]
TDKTVLSNNNFDMAHVLTGEINASGKATGYHAEVASNGAARITPGAAVTQNPNGTYTAPVQIWNEATLSWVDKKGISTFFPLSWSEARIAYEVAEAFKKKIPNPAGGWNGTTVGGIGIQFYWDVKNQRTTFYPLGKP